MSSGGEIDPTLRFNLTVEVLAEVEQESGSPAS